MTAIEPVLTCRDAPYPGAVAAHAIAEGASEVFPIADQPYGLRQGRFADRFGHHRLIGRPL